jgi:hypothetical protein
MLDNYHEKKELSSFRKRKFALFFGIDYMLAFSIVIEYFIFFRGILLYDSKNILPNLGLSKIQLEYYHWSINCMIFIELFTWFVSYNAYKNPGHDQDEEE